MCSFFTNLGEMSLAFARTSTRALLQMLLSNFKLRTLEILGPRERCCPAGQVKNWLSHTTNQSKAIYFRGIASGTCGKQWLHAYNAQKSPACAHKHTTLVSVGLNKTGSYYSSCVTARLFFHSRQTHPVPFASLIGNESAEREALNW